MCFQHLSTAENGHQSIFIAYDNVQIREIESIELKHFVYTGESYSGLNINQNHLLKYSSSVKLAFLPIPYLLFHGLDISVFLK